MILKADRIAERLKKAAQDDELDPLVLTPHPDLAELENSGAAAIDLRLGCWFSSLRHTRLAYLDISTQANESELTRTQYVPFGAKFMLHPQTFVLGVTLEWMRLPRDLAGYVIGKSSWGRRGLIIATATG